LAQTLLPNILVFAQRLQRLQPELTGHSSLVVLRTFLGSLLGFLVTELFFAKALPVTRNMGTLEDTLALLFKGLQVQDGESRKPIFKGDKDVHSNDNNC
jgi:hypothetical protein